MKRLIKRLIFGGSDRLKKPEQTMIELVAMDLDAATKAALGKQLENISLIQRFDKNRVVRIFLNHPESPPTTHDTSTDFCLAEVLFRMGNVENSCKIMTHRGLLSDLQFKKPMSLPDTGSIDVISVTRAPAESTDQTAEIDKQEHDHSNR